MISHMYRIVETDLKSDQTLNQHTKGGKIVWVEKQQQPENSKFNFEKYKILVEFTTL